jgi:hypothetical protein
LRETLVRIEHSFWTSGADFYRANLSEDCRMIVPGVGAMSREAAIEGVAGGERWDDVEISDVA